MSELNPAAMNRTGLIEYLVGHIYKSAGAVYKLQARRTLESQETETLRSMAITTHREHLERAERRHQARQRSKPNERQHTR